MAPNNTFKRSSIDLWDPQSEVQSILHLVDYNAAHNPDHVFAVQLQKDPTAIGATRATEITHRRLKQAVFACGSQLQQDVLRNCVKNGAKEPTPVALLMESDVCLVFYVFALMWLRVPVLLLSARLSPAAIHHLLLETGCSTIISSGGLKKQAEVSLGLFGGTAPVQLQSQLPFEDFLRLGEGLATQPPLAHKKSDDDDDKKRLIFHSSGTTGMPKSIHHPERYFLAFATCHNIDTAPSGPSFSTLPLFHAFGWVPPCLSLSIGMPVCFPPKSTVPNAQAMFEQLRLTEATSLVSVPSILEDFAAAPDLAQASLAHLSFVAFGGGRLKEIAGQTLAAQGVKLLNHFGATETGPLAPLFSPEPTYDWHYFRLRSDIKAQVQSTGPDGDGVEQFQLTIKPLGWTHEFQLQDHFVRNTGSEKPDYSAVGRKDDVLVLANGEKVQPGILEARLIEESSVRAVVVFGNDQAEVGVLLQPATGIPAEEHDAFVDSVWPVIEKANLSMDAHAQVTSRKSILVIPYSTVLPRSDKGSILRREVYAMFSREIEGVYKALETEIGDNAYVLRPASMTEDISKLVHETTRLLVKAEECTNDDDLFGLGLDSLQATQLRRRLQAAIKKADDSVLAARVLPPDFIYRFPSVNKMAKALQGDEVEESDMQQLAARLAFNYEDPQVDTSHAALVTGATGGLGSHLVAEFARMPSVNTVFCLLRPRSGIDARTRLLRVLSERKIQLTDDELDKLYVLECNTSQFELGLSKQQYRHLLGSVRWIVQAGWPMDFKLTLGSFEESFQTLQNLLRLTKGIDTLYGQSRTANFVFISSISTVGMWPELTGETFIPEQCFSESSFAVDIGYAQAKRVCEVIIEKAAHASTMSLRYIRVGQLCGSSQTGMWNAEEHIPALIKSSQTIGALPELRGTLSWIPVDIAAQVVRDITVSEVQDGQIAYHVENPVRQPWADMLLTISKSLAAASGSSPLPLVPYGKWVERLEQHDATDADASPAAKLLPFFKEQFERMACGTVSLDTFEARRSSRALRRLHGVSQQLVGRYVGRWQEIGFVV